MASLQSSVLTGEYFSVLLLLKYGYCSGYCHQFFVNTEKASSFICLRFCYDSSVIKMASF